MNQSASQNVNQDINWHCQHPLQPFWNLAAAPIQAQALEQALEHRLFEKLATMGQPADSGLIAHQLELNPAAVAVWLDLLWSMALLVRHTSAGTSATSSAMPAYTIAPLARQFFTEGASHNCTQAWLYRTRLLAQAGAQLSQYLNQQPSQNLGEKLGEQTGTRPQAQPEAGTWAQAARVQIDQEQRAITVPAVLRLLDELGPLPAQGHFADLGGGPGHVAIALAKRLPLWHGVVCDEPDTVAVARQNIQTAGLGERLHALGCNLDESVAGSDSNGNGVHDLIWCSSVLHFLREPATAVARMARALRPSGLLLLAHAERADDATLAARVLPFYAPMLLRGKHLPAPGDVPGWMEQAGLANIRALGRIAFPMAPVWLYAGCKP